MHPFSVGDVVICINDTPAPGREIEAYFPWPVVGWAYRVATTGTDKDGNHGITLVEIPNRPGIAGWYVWRFRKLDRADDDFISTLPPLHQPAPKEVFTETAVLVLSNCMKSWTVPGKLKTGRAMHVRGLLIGYGDWFHGVFGCYPERSHLEAIALRMFDWRKERTEAIGGYNPWVIAADFPDLCRACLGTSAAMSGR